MMPKFIDLTGKKFKNFTVLEHVGRNKYNKNIWKIKCYCGKEKTTITANIINGRILSCGCFNSYSKKEYYDKVKKDLLEKRILNGDCWEWTGYKFNGYGRRSFGQRKKKRKVEVHRISYMIWKGDIPEDKIVCHSCDNPSCFNPDHLWVGTQKENLHDMISKNRQVYGYGTKMPNAKLDEDKVKEIRKKNKCGEIFSHLAREYEVSLQTISSICQRKAWRHVE